MLHGRYTNGGALDLFMPALAGPEAHTPFEQALRTSPDELGMVQGRAVQPAADLVRA